MQAEYYKFKSDGLMNLSVDNLLYNKIALAHNGIQNGDIMADPDIEVLVNPEKREAEALTFQNDYVGIYQVVYPEEGKCNTKLKKDLNVFLDDWLSNIIDAQYQLTETKCELD
jgi:hypothetical protein